MNIILLVVFSERAQCPRHRGSSARVRDSPRLLLHEVLLESRVHAQKGNTCGTGRENVTHINENVIKWKAVQARIRFRKGVKLVSYEIFIDTFK